MTLLTRMFKSDDRSLRKLMEALVEGELQIPEFQRDWVWDDDDIRSLIASISLSYPVGSLLLLNYNESSLELQSRNIEPVLEVKRSKPDVLVLDGQQRLTALYLALCAAHTKEALALKASKRRRIYYLDIKGCVTQNSDREDAVVSEWLTFDNSDLRRTAEQGDEVSEAEYERHYFPLHIIFNDRRRERWLEGYCAYHKIDREENQDLGSFEKQVLGAIRDYELPSIEISGQASIETICQMFEKINSQGKALTTFELLTARFAISGFNLRKDWTDRRRALSKYGATSRLSAMDFVRAVTLLVTYRRGEQGESVSCKPKAILSLSQEEYESAAADIEAGFGHVGKFAKKEGILAPAHIPYVPQLITLAVVMSCLGDTTRKEAQKKLRQWFWCVVFGEMYSQSADSKCAADVAELIPWIDGNAQAPSTVSKASLSADSLLRLDSRRSSAFRGIMALLRKEKCKDFRTREELCEMVRGVDNHHIFPEAYCRDRELPKENWNSVVNRTLITAKTNRQIGGNAPSKYLPMFCQDNKIEKSEMKEILTAHFIKYSAVTKDDFGSFFRTRANKIIRAIERVTGKIAGDAESEAVDGFVSISTKERHDV